MSDNPNILLMYKIRWSVITNYFSKFFLILVVLVFIIPGGTLSAQADEEITITGTVKDASSGEALPGVNVIMEGTYTGAVTDLNGRFTIVVPDETAILSFSFVGYTAVSVPVGTQRDMLVALSLSSTELEEVVFVGYGVQKKESVVGAISQTTGETIIQGTQGSDLANALTGALPGLR